MLLNGAVLFIHWVDLHCTCVNQRPISCSACTYVPRFLSLLLCTTGGELGTGDLVADPGVTFQLLYS